MSLHYSSWSFPASSSASTSSASTSSSCFRRASRADLDSFDRRENERALKVGARIFSAYETEAGKRSGSSWEQTAPRPVYCYLRNTNGANPRLHPPHPTRRRLPGQDL